MRDSILETEKSQQPDRAGNNLYVVNRDWTISHVGWAGHMAFQSAKRIGEQELIRVDYEKYLLGEEEYLIIGR